MTNLIHFLNGRFVSEEELLISPRDLGFARGFVVYDFIVTYQHQPFRLSEHIDRLMRSAERIGLKVPWSEAQIAEWVKETLAKNDKHSEKMISVYLTGGRGVYMQQSEKPTIIVIIDDRRQQPSSDYVKGIKVKAVKYLRPYPTAKTNFYVEGIKQLSTVKGQGITEIIYYDDSQVFEGAGSNIFAVINNRLTTTKSNILEGVTRNSILNAIQFDIPIEIRNFTFDELLTASEVFLTGSNSEVRGVVQINSKAVGDGKVGVITKEVARQYKKYVDGI